MKREAEAGRELDPYQGYLRTRRDEVRDYYDREAPRYVTKWVPAARYYHQLQARILRRLVPPGRRVLDVGCGIGDQLAAVRPSRGVGIDFSAGMIEQARLRHPDLTFVHLDGDDAARLGETFDYVIVNDTLTEVADVRRFLKRLQAVMTPETRLVVTTWNYLWEMVLQTGAVLKLRSPSPIHNWFSPHDYVGMFEAADYEVVSRGSRVLLPKQVPLVSRLLNDVLAPLPGFNFLGLVFYFVVRPRLALDEDQVRRVSVVVPCKDEEGNVEGLVARIPEMAGGTEIVFVDDRSQDATRSKVLEQIERHPERAIKLVEGPGQGKGAAVRAGMEAAEGDVLMILDADMTVMPEVLPDFLELIATGHGEFVNGSRLVYFMEQGAMRMANEIGNKLFASLFSFILEQPIKDTLCGTKVVLRRDYPKLLEARRELSSVDEWGDYDWIFGAARHNLKIVELPVHYRRRIAGVTKMTNRLRNAAVMLKMSLHGLSRLKFGRAARDA